MIEDTNVLVYFEAIKAIRVLAKILGKNINSHKSKHILTNLIEKV